MVIKNKITKALLLMLLLCGCASAPEAGGMAYIGDVAADESERMVSYSAYLKVKTKDANGFNKQVESLTKSYKGFITEMGTFQTVVRVPADKLKEFIEEISATGNVVDTELSGRDITDAYNDRQLKLESSEKLRERYLLLLEKAKDVKDLLMIEKELARINEEIDRLKGAQKAAKESVQYATISIRYVKESTPGPLGWIFVGIFKAVKWLFIWN